MNGQEEMMRRWKAMAGDTSLEPWDLENMAGFFQCFRPDGRDLPEVFEGVVGADEILPRLLEVYQATADGWEANGVYDGYFIVRNPHPLSVSRATGLLRQHLERAAAIAEAIGCDELAVLLGSPFRLETVEGQAPWPPGDNGSETLIYEAIGDFMRSLTPRESDALLMEEGLYTLACDSNLQHHILWPLYRHDTTVEEPFQPYFDLWKHGARYRLASEHTARVYVPKGMLRP